MDGPVYAIGNAMDALCAKTPAEAWPMYQRVVLPTMTPLLEAHGGAGVDDDDLALAAIGLQTLSTFLPAVTAADAPVYAPWIAITPRLCKSRDTGVRQDAFNFIGVTALHQPAWLTGVAAELVTAMQAAAKRWSSEVTAVENAVAAVLKVVLRLPDAPGLRREAAVGWVLQRLPLEDDVEESRIVHALVVDDVVRGDASSLVGRGAANLPALLRVLATALVADDKALASAAAAAAAAAAAGGAGGGGGGGGAAAGAGGDDEMEVEDGGDDGDGKDGSDDDDDDDDDDDGSSEGGDTEGSRSTIGNSVSGSTGAAARRLANARLLDDATRTKLDGFLAAVTSTPAGPLVAAAVATLKRPLRAGLARHGLRLPS